MSKIIIITGSNGKNLEIAQEFSRYLKKNSIENEIIDLVDLDLPLYTPVAEQNGIPKKVLECRKVLKDALGFVFVTPEYNGGVPPTVTNLIAWISRSGDTNWRSVFNAKPAALASFSGSGGIQALVALRTQLSYIGLNTIGRQLRATSKEPLNIADLEAISNLLIKGILN